MEGGLPNPEVIDDILDKRVAHRVLEHCLGDAGFPCPIPVAGRPCVRAFEPPEAGLGVFDHQLTWAGSLASRPVRPRGVAAETHRKAFHYATVGFPCPRLST